MIYIEKPNVIICPKCKRISIARGNGPILDTYPPQYVYDCLGCGLKFYSQPFRIEEVKEE